MVAVVGFLVHQSNVDREAGRLLEAAHCHLIHGDHDGERIAVRSYAQVHPWAPTRYCITLPVGEQGGGMFGAGSREGGCLVQGGGTFGA